MKSIFLFLSFFFLLIGCKNETQEKPNIIYIMADDLGYGDAGAFGQKIISTPNIDKLASEGMMLTQHYAGNTVCAPSRCTLMTGMHNGHARIRGNKTISLETSDITVAEMMKSAGYTTGLVGKWGLGEEGSTGTPNKKGFDYFYGYLNQVHAHNYYPEFLYENEIKDSLGNVMEYITSGYSAGIGGHSTNKAVYSNTRFQEKSLEFVEKNKNRPFFLYLPVTLPHANNESQHFGESGMEIPSLGIYANKDWPENQKRHAAMISELDKTVGLIMTKLKEDNLDKNTLVIFTSDNGPHAEGGADPDYFDSNGPFRGIKRSLYEGGIRVPTIARWPGKIKAGSSSDHVSGFVDFFETLVDLTKMPSQIKTDGISYLPTLLGKEQKVHEFMYWEFFEEGGKQGVLIDQNWKCIRLFVNDSTKTKIELYDLKNDLGEEKNVADKFPEITAKAIKVINEQHTYNKDFHFDNEANI